MKTLLAIHELDQDLEDIRLMIQMAQSAGAHLNILILSILRTVPVAAAPGIPMVYYSEANQDTIDAGKQRMSDINALLQKEGISASVAFECRDIAVIENTVQRHAMFADATVFPNQTALESPKSNRAFNGALMETGAPVLVLGKDMDTLPDVKTVMYAWNSEPEVAIALRHSLNWIEDATRAHIVLVDPDETIQGPNPGDDIATYLARKNIAVTVDKISSGKREVSDVLLKHASDIGADLIVMGAYGHSRLREWLLGGTTRDILEKATIPVLMAH